MMPDDKEHSDHHFDRELLHVRERLLAMGARVERMIGTAMRALVERDSELAEEVEGLDAEVDRDEREIDNLALSILARRQPMGSDLRFLAISMKVVTDLERIGDFAVNMSERALELITEPLLKPLIDLPRLATIAQEMVRGALDAMVARDPQLAREVIVKVATVQALTDQISRELITYILEDADVGRRAIRLIFTSRYLERVAEHATNIAEMVIFWIEGEDLRHRVVETH